MEGDEGEREKKKGEYEGKCEGGMKETMKERNEREE